MPLPYSPPFSAISEMRSNISIGGNGSCGPSANSSPRPHASRSSYSKLERRSVMPAPFQKAPSVPLRFPNIRHPAGKVPGSTAPCAVLYPLEDALAKELQKRANLDIISFVTIIKSEAVVTQQRTIVQSAVMPASAERVAGVPARAELNGCPWH